MPENCDAACVKIIIDTGMGAEAAKLYRSMIRGEPLFTAAATFYAGVVENVVKPAAQALNALRLSRAQQERLDAQINLQCYPRADYLLRWAQSDPNDRRESWGNDLLKWVADDQKFLIDLVTELRDARGQE